MIVLKTTTHTSQSTANNRDTSCVGASRAANTTSNNTIAAEGTDADETDAAVDVKLQRYICVFLNNKNYAQLQYLTNAKVVNSIPTRRNELFSFSRYGNQTKRVSKVGGNY